MPPPPPPAKAQDRSLELAGLQALMEGQKQREQAAVGDEIAKVQAQLVLASQNAAQVGSELRDFLVDAQEGGHAAEEIDGRERGWSEKLPPHGQDVVRQQGGHAYFKGCILNFPPMYIERYVEMLSR